MIEEQVISSGIQSINKLEAYMMEKIIAINQF